MSAPSLCVWLIAKDEQRDLPRCLQSIREIADHVVLVDTGSTDDTIKVAMANVSVPFMYEVYTDASKLGDDGQWRLEDFSKARNRAIELAEATGCKFHMWMDADDELVSPIGIRRALYADFVDVYAMHIVQGSSRWIHHRICKSSKHLRFKGRAHEYLVLDGMRCAELPNDIRHDAAPGTGETSNARNLRILLQEWDEQRTPRTAFYLGCTYRDGGEHEKAVEWYRARVRFGPDFKDEWLFAHLYWARALHSQGQFSKSIEVAFAGSLEAPEWAEFKMQMAHGYYALKEYARCIEVATTALNLEQQPTVLWREFSQYTDQPARLISFAHEQLGNIAQSLVWAEAAAYRIGAPDAEWDARIAMLKQRQRPKVAQIKRPVIALCRPGAIGDVLMTLNLLPALKAANPGKEIHYFTSTALMQEDALGWIIRAAGADQVLDCNGWEQWSKSAERAVSLVGYPLHEGYPEKPMSCHLLTYFGAEMGIELKALPALALPLPKRFTDEHGGYGSPYATIQTKAGWSRYKEWPIDRWNEVRKAIPFPLVWLDESEGHTLSESISIFAHARMHIGIDSFANHLTQYYWQDESGSGRRVPGVILWGSTQPSAAGYPHNTNLYANPECGPCFRETAVWSKAKRGPCINVVPNTGLHKCMSDITVDEVVTAVREMWARCAG